MTTLTVGAEGEIALPDDLRERHGMQPDTAIRVIETRNGLLLVPLTSEPMSLELVRELEEWQSASLATWEQFPYEEQA
jgi:bifunctional DNA-binding transcriptional regulator/antitoxin component of YhaV-PrlF toxin-antitoxin module